MKNKVISTLIAALVIAGSISFSALAAMSNGTVVIGTKAYDLAYGNDPANADEISSAIVSGGKIYIKDFNGFWIDNNSGLPISTGLIPPIIYKDATRTIEFNIADGNAKVEPIQEPTEELSAELKESINVLKGKVIFDNDISIFTLYAFMNFTGYDEENNIKGYSEVRKSVRSDLSKMNLTLMDNNYYKNKKVQCYYYNQVLSRMDGAPNFTNQQLPKYLSKLDDLGNHLKEFYVKANIEELFKKYNPIYLDEMKSYSEGIYPILAKTNQMLRIDSNTVGKFYFQVNLLDAYWRGYGLGTTYKYKGQILITGPSEKPNLLNVAHEYLHGVITPIDKELRGEIEELSFLMSKVPQNTQATSSAYNNWFSVFDESLVRALSRKFAPMGSDSIENVMKEGFILTEYFDKRFNEFPSFDGSLKDFIKMLITDIKAENK